MERVYKAKHFAYQVVEMFEEEVANYTGASYAVAVDNCTDALFLCCKWKSVEEVFIPSTTYLSVPQSIMQAGGEVVFNLNVNDWHGIYELAPYKIFDASKRFTSSMYIGGSLMCLSFHDKKILKIGKGGMILTDDKNARDWFRRARYEGRGAMAYKKDDIQFMGWNMYMTPEQAARGLTLMANIPIHNDDQKEEGGYRPLTEFTLFKDCRKIEKL